MQNSIAPSLTSRPKSSAPEAVASNAGAVAKRLQSELMNLMMSAVPGISAFPDGDNLFNWVGTIKGSEGTAYEGLSFKLHLKFPADYPFSAPVVSFSTPCFHPNVDMNGNICLDILKDKWSAVYNVRTILLSIQSLLGEPNNDSPLNAQAAQLWDNQPEFRATVLRKYKDVTEQ
eukprot:GILK01001262.1.p1 GENE.GILK01001262.1~~GILK01001262.1.p1  ORF type:complete len:203 (+),score=24.91 GILK01001262.1:88-609(+)